MSIKKTDRLAQELSVYFICGQMNLNALESFQHTLSQALKGGITAFQYREKGEGSLKGQKRIEAAKIAKRLCGEYRVLFIVNDDLELMKAVEADGLHVGQTDGDLAYIREQTKGKILGVSAHTLEEARDAIQKGADYIGTGPVFPTISKLDAKKPVGTGIFKEFRKQGVKIPIVGIGGISLENVSSVIQAGADGAAVISAISQAEDPYAASRELHMKITQAKKVR
jgi:thiamine-phosphate pyrophosphorylase